jgi:hypothetical protein
MWVKTLQNMSIPEEKDTVFVSPEFSRWPSLLAENKLAVRDLSGRPEVRRRLFQIARDYTQTITAEVCPDQAAENFIVTGHQPTWHHCGILAKDLTACHFAERVGGCSLHLVLDHDICDTAIVLPKCDADGFWDFDRIQIEPEQNQVPLEFRRAPHEAYVKTFVSAIADKCPEQLCNSIWSKWLDPEAYKGYRIKSVADLITHFQSKLHTGLGLDMVYLPVSRLAQSDAFVDFAASLVLNAASFAACYNNAVTRQIDDTRTNAQKTVRHLAVDESTGRTELPFWLFLPDGTRASLHVLPEKRGKVGIYANSAPDWFAHGVGGAVYEYVTDRIIENYFGIKSLRFGIATATITLPLPGGDGFARGNVPELRHRLQDAKHNPERHLEPSLLRTEPVKRLIMTKKELIRQTKSDCLPAQARKSAWSSISEVNQRLLEYTKNMVGDLERRIQILKKNEPSNAVRDHREYFFGLFPVETLGNISEALIIEERDRIAQEIR